MLTADNLLPTLKRLGISIDRNRPFDRSAKLPSFKEAEDDSEVIHEAFLGQLSREDCEQGILSSPDVIKEAFQVLQKRQRPPPKGGYPYSKNDHVTTKLGCLPPSPCNVCGSKNHWDKECPDHDVYQEKQQKSAYCVELIEDEDLENYYSSVYSVLITDRLAREYKSPEDAEKDFEEAVLQIRERKSNNPTGTWRKQTMFAEEIEDEYWEEYRAKEKSDIHLLYQDGDEDDLEQRKEAYMASEVKIPKFGDVNSEESFNSSQREPPPSTSNCSPSDGDRPAEVKDPPIIILDPPPLKEKSVRIPRV